ncbi:DUF6383 domain-containing protein [Parabacteroides chongii]|uniref:DUF6383 domain-containing protein n=1 Tax=Parabacteroides chongii TaxID=2685834 RepID=UPI00240D9D77|nr:DUF6383 domain-containing protein [Parabacteroides chongii]WFE86951.1 DUF6383 domain-containing protein [Parabacteroides chongii]
MNKKFSTLLTIFLMVGALFSNVKAAVEVATTFVSGNKYYLSADGSLFLSIKAEDKSLLTIDEAGLDEYAQWTVTSVTSNGYKFVFKNEKSGQLLAAKADGTAFVADQSEANMATAITYFKWYDDAAGAEANGGAKISTGVTDKDVTLDAASGNAATFGTTASATDFKLYVVPAAGISAKTLNDNLGSAFKLSFKKKADLKDNLTVEANPFTSNTIKAVSLDKATAAADAMSYVFRVSGSFEGFTAPAATESEIKAFRASEFIVVDTISYSTLNASLTTSYKYKVVKGSEMVTEDGKIYGTTAHGLTGATNADLAVTRLLGNAVFAVSADVNAPKVLKIASTEAKVSNGVFGNGTAHILDHHKTSVSDAFVTVFTFEGKYYVGTGEGNDTFIALGGSNIVPRLKLLGIVNIISKDRDESTAHKNTYGKVFGPTTTALASAVDAERVMLNKPEGQFLITSTGDGAFTFTNRESGKTYTAAQLYYTDEDAVYANNGDTIKIVPATVGDKYDGYKNYSQNLELEKTAFNIAVYSAVTENVYLTEKHNSAGHFVGLSTDKGNAVNWRLVKFEEKKDASNDSIIYVRNLGYKNSDGKYDTKKDTLVAFTYAIYNEDNGEFLSYNSEKKAYYCNPDLNKLDDARNANVVKFVIKQKGEGVYNLIVATPGTQMADNSVKLYGAFSDDKVNQNETAEGMYYLTDNDLFVIDPVDAPNYRPVATFDTISIYKEGNEKIALYERGQFLGMQHIADVKDMNPALFVDTAYVRNNTNKPQYLLAVNAKRVISDDWCGVPGHVQHKADTTFGRFLVNMVDSAYAYGFDKHDNPYVWENNQSYKLAFVKGFHTNDTLFIERANNVVGDSIWVGKDNGEAIGKYAFRYIDREAGSFIIETQTRDAAGDLTIGFIKWLNGTPAVITARDQAEVFNMNVEETKNPVANETIDATSVSVIAGNGDVTIKGAVGKKVTIANVLGQTIANTVLSSDDATISVPAGVVVVAVDGEAAVKAIVK